MKSPLRLIVSSFPLALLLFGGCNPEEGGPEGDPICGLYGVYSDIHMACMCQKGYGGDFCERCSSGYTGYPDCVEESGGSDGPVPDIDVDTDHDTPPAEGEIPLAEDDAVIPDTDVPDNCDQVTCNGNGKCQEDNSCKCYQGYAGASCDECSAGYIGYPDCYFKMCEPNARTCKDLQTVQQCDELGKEWSDVETCNIDTECFEGECLSECGKAEAAESYVGCEYWGAFLQNGGGYESNGSYAVVVANPNDTEVTVTVYGAGDVQLNQFTVAPSQVNWAQFTTFEQFVTEPGISNKALKFVASRPVTMTQMNPFGNVLIYSNDASLLLPKGALGQKYMAMSWPEWFYSEDDGCGGGTTHSYPGFVSVIAVESGSTTVTVTYRGASRAGTGVAAQNPNDTVEYTLNQYDILTLNTAGASCDSSCYGPDLSGSMISASNKIAVFGGHVCTFIPASTYACDHLEHQIFPLRSWGKEFAAVRTKPRNAEADYFRILASKDGTSVSWAGGASGSVTLSAGQVHEFSTTADFVVTANEPIMVAQFLASQDAGADTGDPAMMLIAPNEQMRQDYIFLVAPNYDYDRLTIVSPADNQITLDGGTVMDSNTFTQIPGTPWYRQYVDTDDGAHTLTATKPVALYVYGFSQYVSYAYTAGLDLQKINDQE
ncbi:MAG TPA: hypothetical protein P5077_10135 [bacterium]|nr:hypothetical protein [bacterium]